MQKTVQKRKDTHVNNGSIIVYRSHFGLLRKKKKHPQKKKSLKKLKLNWKTDFFKD